MTCWPFLNYPYRWMNSLRCFRPKVTYHSTSESSNSVQVVAIRSGTDGSERYGAVPLRSLPVFLSVMPYFLLMGSWRKTLSFRSGNVFLSF